MFRYGNSFSYSSQRCNHEFRKFLNMNIINKYFNISVWSVRCKSLLVIKNFDSKYFWCEVFEILALQGLTFSVYMTNPIFYELWDILQKYPNVQDPFFMKWHYIVRNFKTENKGMHFFKYFCKILMVYSLLHTLYKVCLKCSAITLKCLVNFFYNVIFNQIFNINWSVCYLYNHWTSE